MDLNRASLVLALTALGLSFQGTATAQPFGQYIGAVKAEWLNDGRQMRLLEPFGYVDPSGRQWSAPPGAVIDGASIPKIAWTLIGGPFEGRYRDASVIHDVACAERKHPWELVHETFYWGMLASGVDALRAKVMYAAVYHFGPRWAYTTKRLARDRENAVADIRRGSAPGSEVTVLDSGGSVILRDGGTGMSVTASVAPPALALTAESFSQLKVQIEQREAGAPGGMSLDQIRRFRPVR